MIIDGKNHFMGAYEALKPKSPQTLNDIDNTLKANISKGLSDAFAEINPFGNKSAFTSISQETIDFLCSDAGYERIKRDTEEMYSMYLSQQSINNIGGENNPFINNVATQWMVFSKLLYDNGFYDGMDADEVREKENILKYITAGMDSIGRSQYGAGQHLDINDAEIYKEYSTYMNSTEAHFDLAASTSALKFFADKFLDGDMKKQFYELVDKYVDHNNESLKGYQSINEVFAKNLYDVHASFSGKHASKTQFAGNEEVKYFFNLGGIKQTEEEKIKFQMNINELFENFRINSIDENTLWNQLKESFINFATNNTNDDGFKSYINKQSEGEFKRIINYWTKLSNI